MADTGEGRKKGRRGRKKRSVHRKTHKIRAAWRRRGPDGRRRADLIVAISHPVRRRVLRVLHDGDEPRSPIQITRELPLPLGMVAYHTLVLRRCGAVKLAGEQMVRGAVEHFYETTIKGDPPIETLLEETRETDDEDS
jgi:DNA-binding transcriptional ArsR family regulator